MWPTTTMVTSTIFTLSSQGSRVLPGARVGAVSGAGVAGADIARTIIGSMPLPRRQRVAAYAVIVRDERILLSRLAERISRDELWTLPGGGLDHGEDPRDAVVREIKEETGLDAFVGEQARVYSAHMPHAKRDGGRSDYHALRIVYDAWVPPDAPAPRVLEVDGSTSEAAWHLLSDVLDGTVPTVPMVTQALEDWSPFRMQRVGAYALIRKRDAVLLVRFSEKGFHTG